MLGHSRISHVLLLLCAFTLWAETVMCGSSFLSPSQRPQNRGDRKPPRVGRRTAVELEPPLPTEEKIMASAPFQLAVSLSETEYEEYGPVLHKMLLDVLGDPPAWDEAN
ncbi:ghrelin/obestatin prepropeptide precursor [Silurus asotus]|uniref:Ghrelin/obestatin prepropeptide n=1 Tax=Silurus asotus TaxID=30991 RepID=A0AAD5AQU0_SILAS|nr:ghrelin/obestatin prepropeptide precursor [Silurus asotus]